MVGGQERLEIRTGPAHQLLTEHLTAGVLIVFSRVDL